MKSLEENRCKILYMPMKTVLELFTGSFGFGDHVSRIKYGAEDFPDDVTCVSVDYDPSRRAFAMILCSSQFPAVPDGSLLEEIPGLRCERTVVTHELQVGVVERPYTWRELPPLL